MKKKEEKLDEIKEKEQKIVDTQKKKIMSIRKARITKEKNKLYKLFSTTNIEKKHIINRLIDRASFLLILSEDMETQIKDSDLTILTVNSYQSFTKSNPLLKDYRDTVKSYQTVLKQLCDLIKNDSQMDPNESDELEEFLKR
jgi:hypothetical protein